MATVSPHAENSGEKYCDVADSDLRRSSALTSAILLGIVLLVTILYTGPQVRRGLIGLDDGAFAQMASRVLQGEVPHRDFDELYTGGLTYLHALAFRVFGQSFAVLRWLCFAVFLCWVPIVFWIARRFVTLLPAAGVTLAAVAWSYPNYTAPMPSWYNLFLATAGCAALLEFVQSRKRRWLFLVGVCAALSCLVKIIGLYLLASALVFLIFEEQVESGKSGGTRRTPGYSSFVAISQAVFVFLLAVIVGMHFGLAGLLHFVLPAALLCTFLIWCEWFVRAESSVTRFRRLLGNLLPVVAGFALPVGVFLALMARARALPALWNGLFVLPRLRISAASYAPPTVLLVCMGAIFLLMFYVAAFQPKLKRTLALLLALLFVGVLWKTGTDDSLYRTVFFAASTLVPITTIFALLVLGHWRLRWNLWVGTVLLFLVALVCCFTPIWSWTVPKITTLCLALMLGLWTVIQTRLKDRHAIQTSSEGKHVIHEFSMRRVSDFRARGLFALLLVMAICNLVQFPFASPNYFFYIAPIVLLALTALVSFSSDPPRASLAVLVIFFIFFAAVRLRPSFVDGIGSLYKEDTQITAIISPRAGAIRTSPKNARAYDRVSALVREHASGDYILAGPDCPEIYFLTGKRNATRALFDVFDQSLRDERRVLKIIEEYGINVVVVNERPMFSPQYSASLSNKLEQNFPHSEMIGTFKVRWK